MPARGAKGGGAISPTKIKAAAKKPAAQIKSVPGRPEKVVFKASQVATPSKRLTHTVKQIARQEKEIGTGSLASINREVARKTALPRPPPPKPHGGGANIFSPATILALPGAAVSQGWRNILGNNAVGKAVGQGLGEVASIGTFPLIGAFSAGHAGAQVLKGKPAEAKELAGGFASGLQHGAVGELVQGHPKGALKAFGAAPVISSAEVLGAEGATGRAAGFVKRKVTPGVGGTTIRPPVSLTQDAGTAKQGDFVRQRRYSKDLWREIGQKAFESRKPMVDSSGKVVTLDELGHQVPVLKPKNEHEEIKLQKERARHEAGEKQAGEFRSRQEAEKTIKKIESPGRTPKKVVKGKQLRELGHIIATARIRTPETFREDLLKERVKTEAALKKHERLTKEGKDSNFRTDEERRRAESNVRMFKKVEADPKLDEKIPALMRMGEGFGAAGYKADIRNAELGIRPEGEMERARLSETAYAHQGARYHSATTLKALEEEALVHEREVATEIQKMRPGPERKGLEDLHAALKEDRIGVSGRDPEQMARWEEAQKVAADATQRRIEAQRASGAPEHRPAERMAAAGEARGPKPAQRMQAVGETTGESRLRLAEAEEKAAHLEAEKVKKPAIQEGIRKASGHHLSTEEMRKALEDVGRSPETVAYVPHVVGSTGKGAYHMPFRPGMRPSPFPTRTRTGALQERGATEISMESVINEQVKKGVAANLAEHIDSLVHDAALKAPDGKPFESPKAAAEFADRLKKEGKGEYTPFRPMAAGLSNELKAIVAEHQNPGTMDTLHLEMLRSRIPDREDPTRGDTLLLPTHLLHEHLTLAKGSNEVEMLLQGSVGLFRRAVLSQDRWLVGNAAEPYLWRLPMSGAGINLPGLGFDIAATMKVTKAMAAKGSAKAAWALKQLDAHQLRSGLFVGKQRASSTYRVPEDFSGKLRSTLIGLRVVRRLPIVKQVADMTIALTDVFFAANKEIEKSTQFQSFGKMAREDIQNFTGKFYETLKLGKAAVEEIAQYQERTATRERYTKAMHDMLGQYDDWGPMMKRFARTYTPFVPWTLASMRFMYWTMPAHHSVAFATLMKLGQSAIGDWEKEHAELRKAGITGTLANAAIVKKPGQPPGYIDWARYFPSGVTMPIKEGNFESLAGLVTPQLEGVKEAISGRSNFGQPLRVGKTKENPKGEVTSGAEKVGIGLNTFLESTVPLLAQGKRAMQHGGTAYDNSNIIGEIKRKIEGREPDIKPGSSFETAANRLFNPLREAHIKPKPGTGKKGRKAKLGPTGSTKLGPSGGSSLGPAR